MKDYNTAYIRQEIRSHRKNCAMQGRLEASIRRNGKISETQMGQLFQLQEKNATVENWLSLLSEDEAYVIQRHLIDGITWPRVWAEYGEKWKEYAKCERTLMRYQEHALKKIQSFMNEQEGIDIREN